MSRDRELSTLERLPREIVFDIISRLATANLHDVKLVCKSWHKMVREQAFIEMHFSRMAEEDPCLILLADYPLQNQIYALYFFLHSDNRGFVRKFHVPVMPEFDVVGICNGWLCLCDSLYKNTFHMYDPFTSECLVLPVSTQESGQWPVFGFGFLSTTKKYKVVKITHTRRNRSSQSEVRILTVGDPDWRSLGYTAYHPMATGSQVMVGGRLHWVTWPRKYGPSWLLVSFDLDDEQFRQIPKPDSPGLERNGYNLLVLGGCLSAAYHYNYGAYDIWVMKEYGVRNSWIKEFSISGYVSRGLRRDWDSPFRVSKFYKKSSFRRVLCGLKNGEILLEDGCRALFSYDPDSKTFSEITVPGMPNWFQSVVHVGCLSSDNNPVGI